MLNSTESRQPLTSAGHPVAPSTITRKKSRWPLIEDIFVHLLLLAITAIVLFPIIWIVSLSLDPRNITTPTTLTLIPDGASLDAFRHVLTEDLTNGIRFWTLFKNSLIISLGTSALVTIFAISAAYAFARFRFPGRKWGLFAFIAVLMLPQVATLAPLFVLLSRVNLPWSDETVRTTLIGIGIAYISGALPFAIWNLRGYIDTIPRDLEEAAMTEGAGPNRAFIDVILPLVMPAVAITILFGFMAAWTEYVLAWTFLNDPSRFTLAMGLYAMAGSQYNQTPWSQFAAMSILITLPVVVLFFILQRWIVSGLAVGSVKG
jgi:arabinogalactan oligomer/maltooligosaccharide transport system permease protein